MKKTYIKPFAATVYVQSTAMICGSKDVTSSNEEINYGGVDEEGTKEPAVRRYHDVWEDEELEEEEEEW